MTLDDIRHLIEAATPGPWDYEHSSYAQGNIHHYLVRAGSKERVTASEDVFQTWQDAAFVAASRTLMPKLLAVAEAAQSFVRENESQRSGRLEVGEYDTLIDAIKALEGGVSCTKILYPTKELAARWAEKRKMRAYPCKECGGFHLTRLRVKK